MDIEGMGEKVCEEFFALGFIKSIPDIYLLHHHKDEIIEIDDMQTAYPDAVKYDLTGCRLTQTLYYVSEGIPVLISWEGGRKALILGYDSSNIWIYDQESGMTSRRVIVDVEAELGAHTSQYLAFLR